MCFVDNISMSVSSYVGLRPLWFHTHTPPPCFSSLTRFLHALVQSVRFTFQLYYGKQHGFRLLGLCRSYCWSLLSSTAVPVINFIDFMCFCNDLYFRDSIRLFYFVLYVRLCIDFLLDVVDLTRNTHIYSMYFCSYRRVTGLIITHQMAALYTARRQEMIDVLYPLCQFILLGYSFHLLQFQAWDPSAANQAKSFSRLSHAGPDRRRPQPPLPRLQRSPPHPGLLLHAQSSLRQLLWKWLHRTSQSKAPDPDLRVSLSMLPIRSTSDCEYLQIPLVEC